MKKLLPFLLLTIISCSKKEAVTPPVTGTTITYTSATKVNAGSSFTLRINFTLSGAANIQSLQVYKSLTPNNRIPVTLSEGPQSVIDGSPAGVGNGITYYFDGTKKDGTKINQSFIVNY